MKKSLILRQVKGVEVGCDLKQQTVSKGKDKKDKKGILNVEYEEKLIFFFLNLSQNFSRLNIDIGLSGVCEFVCPYSTDQIAEPGPECRVEAHIPQRDVFERSLYSVCCLQGSWC